MSRVLFLQCFRPRPSWAPAPHGIRFDQEIGVLSSVLRAEGHETALIPVSRLDPASLSALSAQVARAAPDVVYAVIDGSAVDLARRVIGVISASRPCRVVAGGQMPTVAASLALSMPGVTGVVLGEPETSFPAFLCELNGTGIPMVPGVSVNALGAAPSTAPAALTEDLDRLPFADRELFRIPETEEVFDIVTSRGCPMSCAYCVNDARRALYDGTASFVRRRSPDNVCDEIDAICMRYENARRIRFVDHAFALDYVWLKEFAQTYEERCGMPFSCHVRANSLDEGRADLLQLAGCDFAEVEVISGSNFIRNEILEMDTTQGQIERTFMLLHNRGIGTRAVNYVGVPYSSEITEQDTIRLNRTLKPDEIDVRVYFPFPGTGAAETARQMGWLSNRGEDAFTHGRSVLDMPTLPPKLIQRIARHMPREIHALSSSGVWRAIGRIPLAPGKTVADLVEFLYQVRSRPVQHPRR